MGAKRGCRFRPSSAMNFGGEGLKAEARGEHPRLWSGPHLIVLRTASYAVRHPRSAVGGWFATAGEEVGIATSFTPSAPNTRSRLVSMSTQASFPTLRISSRRAWSEGRPSNSRSVAASSCSNRATGASPVVPCTLTAHRGADLGRRRRRYLGREPALRRAGRSFDDETHPLDSFPGHGG